MMTTIKEVRKAFWEAHPEFKNEYNKSFTQNQYKADIRISFVEFVNYLKTDEQISDSLAKRVTL